MKKKLSAPFYDPEKTYEENYNKGPFGAFKDGKKWKNSGKPNFNFLGQKVYSPFGIPAGPILNSKFAKAAFQKGFDIVVYKSVRSDFYPCHPFPNILAIHVKGNLTLERLEKPLIADKKYSSPLSITNSFGVPSRAANVWQADGKKAISYAGKGQVLVLSFMGTVRANQTQKEFVDDFIQTAKLSYETGAKVLEANLSCPNIGNEGLVCYNLEATKKIVKGIRKVIGKTPLILKIGYFSNNKDLEKLAKIADQYADSISAINTLQAEILDRKGRQALPGKMRLRSGVCGQAIKWAGIDMVKRLNRIRKRNNYKFSIEGVGGVISPKDYFDYKKAGANAVMSATGAMWNPFLAQQIKTAFS